jgi:hypothetical protein
MGEQTCVQGFTEKRKGKGTFGRPWRRWQYNMNRILNKQFKDSIYCIFVSQNKNNLRALVKQVINFRGSKNERDFWSS